MPSFVEVQAIDFKQVNMKYFCTKQSHDGELTLEGCIQKDRNGCGGVGMQTWDQVEAYQSLPGASNNYMGTVLEEENRSLNLKGATKVTKIRR